MFVQLDKIDKKLINFTDKGLLLSTYCQKLVC